MKKDRKNQRQSTTNVVVRFFCVHISPRTSSTVVRVQVVGVSKVQGRSNEKETGPAEVRRIERFCIQFYGIFKTESLSDRVRVRPVASRRWLSTKTVLHFVGRFGGFV